MKQQSPRILSLAAGLSRDHHGLSIPAREAIAKRILAPVRNHEKQWDALRRLSKSKLLTIQANRRGGKTFGVIRWIIAKCVARKTKVTILTQFLAQPTATCLDNGREDCLVEILRAEGLLNHVRILRTQGSIRRIRFVWGSVIEVVEASAASSIDKSRGTTADVFWADEAQSQPNLAMMLTKIIGPMLADSDACVILTGTPGTEIDSFFRRCAQGMEAGWDRCAFYSWDNPFYGELSDDRWRRVLESSIEKLRARYGITDVDLDLLRSLNAAERVAIAEGQDTILRSEIHAWLQVADHDLLREYFGRWVKSSTDYVFNWHREDMYYAAMSGHSSSLPIAQTMGERFALLPHHPLRRWYAAIGVDLGVQDPSAWVVWVYANNHPLAYELWSEKQTGLPDSEVFAHLERIIDEVQALGVTVFGAVADNKGTRKGVGMDWDMQLRSRVPSGVKVPKSMRTMDRVRAFNLDLGASRYRVVKGSPLDIEGTYLKWRPQDPDRPTLPTPWKERKVVLPDGRQDRPGDHCLDASLYALQDLDILWNVEPEPPLTQEQARAEEHKAFLRRALSTNNHHRSHHRRR